MLFTRFPLPGAAKTRLIPALGEEGAAQLHRELAEHALKKIRAFGTPHIEVWFTGSDETAMREWLGTDTSLRPQCEGNLGRRMAHAFDSAFERGAQAAVIAGTDCPDLGPETYEAAFDAMVARSIVIGPATDGGYYLLGIRRDAWPSAALLFENVDWGTDRVFAQTLERISRARLDFACTAPLTDIDEPDDLDVWRRTALRDAKPPELTVVIPTFNAGEHFAATLRSVGQEPRVEVLVADAGSTDGTRDLALSSGARVLTVPRGRAMQMNFASAHACGDVILFLHSDTILPQGYLREVQRALAQPDVIAGAFRFATDHIAPGMHIIEVSANLRARWLQLPYGDQGIFLRLTDFRRLGGFRDMPIMDDFDFFVRARRLGRIAIADSAAITSGRRWRALGVWRTMLRNQAVVALHLCGVPSGKLARYYRRGMDR